MESRPTAAEGDTQKTVASNCVPENDNDNRGTSDGPKSMKNDGSSKRGTKQSAGNKHKREDDESSETKGKSMKKRLTRNRPWDGNTRRDRNIDSREEQGQRGQEFEREERRPKKKVACFIGYSGEGYHGMQYNPPVKTIEGDIYEAFARAGAILKANAADPSKSSFQRAARTDKGVHAAGNLISLKLMIGDDPDQVVQKVNEHLPPQIRIWGIQRTNNAFNSHTHCDSRVYEYILPSHCFLPPKPGSTASLCTRSIESQAREIEPEDTFWDPIIEPDFYSLLQRYNSNRKDSTEKLPDLSQEELDRFDKLRSTETDSIRSFRLSPSRLSRIRSAFKIYLGTHNFHNLTIGVPHNSGHALRYVMDINVSDPKIIGATEWLRIKIHGQSFMLHQIRKMIGAVLIAIRLGVGEDSIRYTLTTPNNVHVPKAPAQGLLLERPVFTGISEKIKKFGNEALNWEPYEEKIENFKEEFIYKSIFRETTAENIFHEFINFMDTFKYDAETGLSLFVKGIEAEVVDSLENDEDEDNVKGDNENVEG